MKDPLLIEINERGEWNTFGKLPSRNDPHYFLGIFLGRIAALHQSRITLTLYNVTQFWEKPVKL